MSNYKNILMQYFVLLFMISSNCFGQTTKLTFVIKDARGARIKTQINGKIVIYQISYGVEKPIGGIEIKNDSVNVFVWTSNEQLEFSDSISYLYKCDEWSHYSQSIMISGSHQPKQLEFRLNPIPYCELKRIMTRNNWRKYKRENR